MSSLMTIVVIHFSSCVHVLNVNIGEHSRQYFSLLWAQKVKQNVLADVF
jgi:hypothetical protein